MEKENSIELIDLLRVLWKWKSLIAIVTLACAIAVGIISFSMQKIYEVSMIIEPGVFEIGTGGKFTYLDSSTNIKSKIDSQAYNTRILKELHLDPVEMKLMFRTIQPENSNTIKISFEIKDIKSGIQALSTLYRELVREYQHYVDSRKLDLEHKIAMNRRTLDHGAIEKKHLEEEIKKVKANTDEIIKERRALINQGKNNEDRLSLLIYTNIVQQNMAYYNRLIKQLGMFMANSEKIKSEIETLSIKRESIENIKLIQAPQSSFYPVKPKKVLNIALAFVIGGIVSVILAFFLEYLQKMRSVT